MPAALRRQLVEVDIRWLQAAGDWLSFLDERQDSELVRYPIN